MPDTTKPFEWVQAVLEDIGDFLAANGLQKEAAEIHEIGRIITTKTNGDPPLDLAMDSPKSCRELQHLSRSAQ